MAQARTTKEMIAMQVSDENGINPNQADAGLYHPLLGALTTIKED
jgi:hypothetical protein